jgi:hypothetical protein
VDEQANRAPAPSTIVRLGLAAFVLAWILGPSVLRTYVPIWPVFLLALGLELHFFLEARRSLPALAWSRGRGPQAVDRERYGYGADGAEDLLVVRDGGEDLWLPYSGESEEELEELIAEARARREEDEQQPEPEPDWEPEPPPARRRPALRRLATGVALIGALAATLWIVESRSGWSGLDREARVEAVQLFSAEASRLAEKPVSIQCDESGEHVGVVQHADGAAIVGGNVAYLTPERCYDLYRLAFRGEVSSSQTARALAVLAHEAWHLRGIRDEGTTECYALQSAVEIGRRFGLSEESARQMMRQRLSENVLHRRGTPEYLVPAECRAGGSLDLNPDDPRFP